MSPQAVELLREVDEEFRTKGAKTPGWKDPHEEPSYVSGPDDGPREEEYSRVSDIGKYDIVLARADSWIAVLRRRGATVVDEPVTWVSDDEYGTAADRYVTLTGGEEGNPPLILGFSESDGEYISSLVLGFGSPGIPLMRIPDCGCDACDDGSTGLLEQVDETIFSIVDGSMECRTEGKMVVNRNSLGSSEIFYSDAPMVRSQQRSATWFQDWESRSRQQWVDTSEGSLEVEFHSGRGPARHRVD